MSSGVGHPAALRKDATVAGNNCTDAVFSTTSLHNSSLAVPRQSRAMRSAARIPSGVAALPSPSRFAVTFADSAESVSGSRLASGNSPRSIGRNSRASPDAAPDTRNSSITPPHNISAPAIETHSSTADAAPVSAAFVTASSRPVSAPKTSEQTTSPDQIRDNAILFHSLKFLVKTAPNIPKILKKHQNFKTFTNCSQKVFAL